MNIKDIYLRELRRNHRLLTRDEELALAKRSKSGDRQATQTLALSIMPMVVRLALRFIGNGVEFEDLIQVGNIGLLRAIEQFDTARGCRLTTYAHSKIRREMQYEILSHGSTIHVPLHATEKENRMGFSDDELLRVRKMRMPLMSLDAGMDHTDDGSTVWSATIPGRESSPCEVVGDAEEIENLQCAIDSLPERQRTVTQLRLAGETLSAVGKMIGVSKERVRQIETDALYGLKRMYGALQGVA